MRNIIYLIVVCIWSCGYSSSNSTISLEGVEPVLIDTFTNQLGYDTVTSITEAKFRPMYMGVKKDSILLNYWPCEIKYQSTDWDAYKRPDSNDLHIYVDTTQIISSVNRLRIPPPPTIENDEYKWERKLLRGKTKSYPILVKNESKDTLSVGYGEYIPLIIEAKDCLGNWKPIQKPYIYFCGTGLMHYYLPPEDIIITSCKLYEGDYETTMRLVFGWDKQIKSNEFKGKMHYHQFHPPKKRY